MPCKCSGVRFDKCRCTLQAPVYPLTSTNQYMILTRKNSAFYKHLVVKPAKRNFMLRGIECAYEKCAGYNLRYCPLRRPHGGCTVRELFRDLVNVTCFLLANAVVFTTILSRMTFNVGVAVTSALQWIKRSISSKMLMENDDSKSIYPKSSPRYL